MIELKKPKPKDVPAMQKMVAKEVANAIILPRSDDEVSTNIRSYTIATNDNEIIGYAALHFHTVNLAEVRSLVVSDEYRGQGVGSMIVKKILDEAREYEIAQVFTLTYKKSFFEKLGFYEIEKTQLPAQKIWADCAKCKRFPICDEIALIYDI
ncbi:N-acetyltransferase [Campylobacter mucosalis]|uniref:Acetyltransferase n=1 Tax=Campylobacter mucosalis CCUG 21559 TaxID=1032067 RepID=A0A6G5QGQ0_9BACT|nr:N-acetyltransferase [Campylobacter mucosalis]KEA46246.1 acetyltransferase [Campylobacter mucosalis]QCD44794.1 acetyltransferase [Campylobacter mucosalis CCUG 21559]QKF62705.1 acetyltransferase [Campylobacter mucosalis]